MNRHTESATRPAPVMLTGLPRCGSSWVGQVLADSPDVRYRYESLNAHWVPALRGVLGHFRYQRPGTPGPVRLRAATRAAFEGRQSARQRMRALYRGYATAAWRRSGRLVLKDPTAVLLSGWLAGRMPLQVVLLVRHPCGFASSVQALEWPFHLERLLSQRPLLRDHLEPWEAVMENARKDPWQALAAFWAAVHRVVLAQAAPDWILARYESLCESPQTAFQALAAQLALTVAPQQAKPDTHRRDPGSTRKNSRRMAQIWQERMSQAQVDTVMETVERFGLLDFAEARSDSAGPPERT